MQRAFNKRAPAWRRLPLSQAILFALVAGGVSFGVQAQTANWFAAGANPQARAARGPVPAAGVPASVRQQQQARQQFTRSVANLNQTANAIAAQQAAQAAARAQAHALPGDVPDGMAEGGLKLQAGVADNAIRPTQVLDVTRWKGAALPSQGSDANGRVLVTVAQNESRAILNWETFNVGRNTTVKFDQQGRNDWAVLNRVNDPQARPSVIQGQLQADGTVMIVNRNGVVFSGSSQVNVRNLVAAAAHIGDDQFTDRGLYGASDTTPTFIDALGRIEVQRGARISTHAAPTATQEGGYVLLAGTEVHQAGEITTPRGQAILAAGDTFLIRRGVGTETNTISTTRGNEIAPQFNPSSSAGSVHNSGVILAQLGDVTLAGRDVLQDGVAIATTSVSARGAVHLLTPAKDAQARVTLGANATTAVLLEANDETAVDGQRDLLIEESRRLNEERRLAVVPSQWDNLSRLEDRRDQSRVEIVSGGGVAFHDGSLTLATGGQIAVSTGNGGTNLGGRVLVNDGAALDVAGALGVRVAMESNSVRIDVQGNELRDSPGNRDSRSLNNSELWIDRRSLVHIAADFDALTNPHGYQRDRWYTAGGLLEVGGYLDTAGHTIGEWAAAGGAITLAGAEVVTQTRSSINLSGGTLDVQDGFIRQSWVRANNGRLYEVSSAPGDMLYEGVYRGYEVSSVRWGENATRRFYDPLIAPTHRYESGYTVGRDAGQLRISAPTVVLEGQLDTSVFTGDRQMLAPQRNADPYAQSQFALARQARLAYGNFWNLPAATPYQPDVRFGEFEAVSGGLDLSSALPSARVGTMWLDAAALNATGLGGLDIVTAGAITIEKALTLQEGGTVNLISAQLEVQDALTVHAGDITLSTRYPVAPTGVDLSQASIVVKNGASLDVSGKWSNLHDGSGAMAEAGLLNGGTITLWAEQGHVGLEQGSTVDVGGGAQLRQDRSVQGGRAGDVSVTATTLQLDGTLRAMGVQGGGALAISTRGEIIIGGDEGSAPPRTITIPGETPHTVARLRLDTDFFRLGFSQYTLDGFYGVEVADGVTVSPVVPTLRVSNQAQELASGRAAEGPFDIWTAEARGLYQPDPLSATLSARPGASLTLLSSGVHGSRRVAVGGIRVGQGSELRVDPGQSLRLESNGQITVEGALVAPGGSISLSLAPSKGGELIYLDPASGAPTYDTGGMAIWVGETARLDVSGHLEQHVDRRGRRYGLAQDGGAITLEGGRGFVVLRPGSMLNASGASAIFDVPSSSVMASSSPTPVSVGGRGGSISISTETAAFLDGSMEARGGSAAASGGALSVSIELPEYLTQAGGAVLPDAFRQAREIVVAQAHGKSLLVDDLQPGVDDPSLLPGKTRIGVDQVEAGGFGSLTLRAGNFITFDGDVSLSLPEMLALRGGSLSAGTPDAKVLLRAPYVLLDGVGRIPEYGLGHIVSFNLGAYAPALQANQAVFSVDTDTLDIQHELNFGRRGTLEWTTGTQEILRPGFDSVLLRSRGDMRYLASSLPASFTQLRTDGDLLLSAARIYPASGAIARIYAGYRVGGMDASRTLRIASVDNPSLSAIVPQSIYGSISLFGSSIYQGGVIHAPLGYIQLGDTDTYYGDRVVLERGSLTSVSAAGLMMPFGGTVDGVNYLYNGDPVFERPMGDGNLGISLRAQTVLGEAGSVLDLSGGGSLQGAGFVSGRGGSTDARFQPLIVVNDSGSFTLPALASAANPGGRQIYAIMPGKQASAAPVGLEQGASQSRVGEQISIPEGVPGLPAGTYTLMPSQYSLMPGAFRVEFGGTTTTAVISGARSLRNGSYIASGYRSVANTSVRDVLATNLVLTPAAVLRQYSQYNETAYSDFARAEALRVALPRPMLPEDGKTLDLRWDTRNVLSDGEALVFDGIANFAPAKGGYAGQLAVSADFSKLEVRAQGSALTAGVISVVDDELNAFRAPRVILGGTLSQASGGAPLLQFTSQTNQVTLRAGATLRTAEAFLVATGSADARITVEHGARIDTLGQGAVPYDSTNGYWYQPDRVGMLAVSNGLIDVLPAGRGAGSLQASIHLGECSAGGCEDVRLYSEGTIALATPKEVSFGDALRYGTRKLLLSVPSLNIGTDASLASAKAAEVLPGGLQLTQSLLTRLLRGDPEAGAPALQSLDFTVDSSTNFFGTVDLSTIDPVTGKSSLAQLVLNTPAIYGYGSAQDVVTLQTGRLIWNGVGDGAQYLNGSTQAGTVPTSLKPGAVIKDGAGTGQGQFSIRAEEIVLGYPDAAYQDGELVMDRLALGFSDVVMSASRHVLVDHRGTLAVHQGQGAFDSAKGDFSYTGGRLHIDTPLLTAGSGAKVSLAAGESLDILNSWGTTAAAPAEKLGGTLMLRSERISVDSVIGLPSGRLELNAQGDISLGEGAQLSLAGRPVAFFDVTRYGWGGDVVLESAEGNIWQAAGSVIDVSAQGNDGGSIKITALASAKGEVSLRGKLLGQGTEGGEGGRIDIRAQRLGTGDLSTEFSSLNQTLNDGGVFGVRSFAIKQGSLSVADGVKASVINISVDGGSLTVNGLVDAAGNRPGSIRLAARDGLTLTGRSVLTVQSNQLYRDAENQVIEASNRGQIELNSGLGTLVLERSASMDLSAADGVSRGRLSLYAPRNDATGDIAFSAETGLAIKGAQQISLYGVRTYTDAAYGLGTGGVRDVLANGKQYQVIDQAYLNRLHGESNDFMVLAHANASLQGRLAGLLEPGLAERFHLRPGVVIESATPDGELVVKGDLDLSAYRYAGGATYGLQRDTGVVGSGEPGSLAIRAGGDLHIFGSINDGFAFTPGFTTPDDNGWVLRSGPEPFLADLVLPKSVVVRGAATGTVTSIALTTGAALNYDIVIRPATLKADALIPMEVVVATAAGITLPAGTVLTADIVRPGLPTLAKGTLLQQAESVPKDSRLLQGSRLPVRVDIAQVLVPKGTLLSIFEKTTTGGVATLPALILAQNVTLPVGAFVPAGSNLQLATGTTVNLRDPVGGRQGQVWAVAPMIATPGTQSWDLRLVGGADLGSIDTRALRAQQSLNGSGNVVLSDPHYMTGLGAAITPPIFSVIRTGTGNLDVLAAGDYLQTSLYGVYTAGTPSESLGGANYELPRGDAHSLYCAASTARSDCTLMGLASQSGTAYVAPATALYRAWYPESGGDLHVRVQGNMMSDTLGGAQAQPTPTTTYGKPHSSNFVGNWLWRQAGPDTSQPAAWWINFGAYAAVSNGWSTTSSLWDRRPNVVGFTGLGTLGGGNVNLDVGGDAGVLSSRGFHNSGVQGGVSARSQALNIAVGSTGRVSSDGKQLHLTGGGDVTIRIGGALNPLSGYLNASRMGSGTMRGLLNDLNGTLVNLRGRLDLVAGSIGRVEPAFNDTQIAFADPRGVLPYSPVSARSSGGLVVVPGDAQISLAARGDLVLGGAGDAGRLDLINEVPYVNPADGISLPGGGVGWFTLWTPNTTIDLASAGGDLTPSTQPLYASDSSSAGATTTNRYSNDIVSNDVHAIQGGVRTFGFYIYPSVLRAQALDGSIYMGTSSLSANKSLLLAPSPNGELELLAGESIFAGNSVGALAVHMSGAAMSTLATPRNPGFKGYEVRAGLRGTSRKVNTSSNGRSSTLDPDNRLNHLFAFGDNTWSPSLHDEDSPPIRFYAVKGDILGLRSGTRMMFDPSLEAAATLGAVRDRTWYIAAKPVWMRAGRDIVDTGVAQVDGASPGNLYAHGHATDVSLIQAGRDVLYTDVAVAGAGLLEVIAGRNLYQADQASLVTLGAVVSDASLARTGGASISIMAGAGEAEAAYAAFATRYFDAGNLADPAEPLDSVGNQGKVAKTYARELKDWLAQRHGYAGTEERALQAFLALAPEHQRIFVRSVYFDELKAGGREYNDAGSRRFGSYLRGRQAIATLFPYMRTPSESGGYDGGVTLFGNSGIRTLFGGGVQILTPGGQQVYGIEGTTPSSSAGVTTQGDGDIQMFSRNSILLGQSRVMTTFGGSVLAWSAEGDINAGRGAKTTIVFPPARRTYNDLGNVTVSPVVPSTGAGFATIAPIAEVQPGDMDLIAPLGTIDAGEAGIRSSGSVNVAALQVVNAANIRAAGETTGVPVVAAVNVGALTNASAAAASAASSAQETVQRSRAEARQNLPSIISVQILGFGEEGGAAPSALPPARQPASQPVSYNPSSTMQLVGNGSLSEAQRGQLTDRERANAL